MGIDHAEALILLPQMLEQQGEGRVFEHIGEVTGVIGVTVVHRG